MTIITFMAPRPCPSTHSTSLQHLQSRRGGGGLRPLSADFAAWPQLIFWQFVIVIVRVAMQPIEDARASLRAVSPRALVDALALAIFRVWHVLIDAHKHFKYIFQAAPSNVRSLCSPAVPRQKLRRAAYAVLSLSLSLSPHFICLVS
jgi:hypothetical protein